MKSIFTFLLLLAATLVNAQNPTLTSAKQLGGTAWDQGNATVVDAVGNVYITGHFEGTADFDPGGGTFNMTASGSRDIFITKLDASGNFVWAKRIGNSSGFDMGNSIAVDAAGNVYTTGEFQGLLVDFDPGATTFQLSASGSYDVFVLKLDASGNFVWAKRIGGTGDDFGQELRLGPTGDVHITGWFEGTTDFDPSPATFNLTSAGNRDIYVTKLDAATGNLIWAKQMGGSSIDVGFSLAVDAAGSVFTTGNFAGTADFDPGAGTFNMTGSTDLFISKLDAAGNFVWAKSAGGAGQDFGREIALDAAGNILTTGRYVGPVDFDPGAGIATLTGNDDVFVLKLDPSGNFLWVKDFQTTGIIEVASLAVDAGGNVYTTGYFNTAMDFDPGAGTNTLTPTGKNGFVVKLDGSGNLVWAIKVGSSTNNEPMSVAVDALNNIYITGLFCCTSNFDPGPGTSNLTAAGSVDAFLLKLAQAPSLPLKLEGFTATKCAGNVCLQWKTNNEVNVSHFEVERSSNGRSFETISRTTAQNVSRGMYHASDKSSNSDVFYRLKTVDKDGSIAYSHIVKVGAEKAGRLVISPNPASSKISIQGFEKADEVRLVDMQGRLVGRLMPTPDNTYDIQFLNAGVYWLQLIVKGELYTSKFIKK